MSSQSEDNLCASERQRLLNQPAKQLSGCMVVSVSRLRQFEATTNSTMLAQFKEPTLTHLIFEALLSVMARLVILSSVAFMLYSSK